MPSNRTRNAGRSTQCLQVLRLRSAEIVHPEEIDSQTPNASLVKVLEYARSDLSVGKSDNTARRRADLLERLQQKAVIRTVKTGLDEHHPFDRERRRNRRVLLQSAAGMVVTRSRNTWEAVRRSERMHMGIARVRRHQNGGARYILPRAGGVGIPPSPPKRHGEKTSRVLPPHN